MDRDLGSVVEHDRIRAELNRILASESFRRSKRRRDLLRWAVERALTSGEPPKEFEIALEVYGKPPSWDSRLDPVVRVEFGRLRKDIERYYETEGAGDPLRISFPNRGYAPVFAPRIQSPNPEPRRRRSLWIAVVIAVSLCAVALWLDSARSRRRVPVTAIAVLPFRDFSPGHNNAPLADGLTDEITNELVRLPGVRVAARTSAFQFRGRDVDVREVGRLLGVGSVVEGSIQLNEDRVRVVAQLIRASDGTHLWAETFESDRFDLMKLRQDISRTIANTLRLRLAAAQTLASTGGSLKPEAQDAYLKGLSQLDQLTPEGLSEALASLSNVVAAEPGFARGWRARALVRLNRANAGGAEPAVEYAAARLDLARALELDPRLPDVKAMLAGIEYVAGWNWPQAEALYRESLLAADTVYARQNYGLSLLTRGRIAEAEQQLRKALELDPLSAYEHLVFAWALLVTSQLESAQAELAEARRLQPRWVMVPMTALEAACRRRDPKAAREALAEARRLSPGLSGSPVERVGEAACEALDGHRDRVRSMLTELERTAFPGYRPSRYNLALIAAAIGDEETMFRNLNQAAEARESLLLNVKIDPLLSRWQQDPRMVELKKRVRLE